MVAVFVALIYEVNSLFAGAFREQINILTFITDSNQFLQAKKLEIVGEIFEEVADARVIAVTQHRLTTEMFAVMAQLIVYVFKLSIKLIFLGFLSLVEILVSHPLLKCDWDDGYLPRNQQELKKHRDCLLNNIGASAMCR